MFNLSSMLEFSTRENPNKTAIIFGDKSFTFAQINAMANQVANALYEIGIEKGDKVALTCPNIPYFPIVYYGILKTGAVVVPINLLLKGREVAYHLKDSEAKAYFCFQGSSEVPMGEEGYKGFQENENCKSMVVITADPTAASPFENVPTLGQFIGKQSPSFETVQTSPDDSAVILYTSGTTGFPKGAELSHANMGMNAIASREMVRLTHDDVHVITLPLFHSFGQTVQMNAGFSMSNTLILIPKFDPAVVLNAIQNGGATVFGGVPSMYWGLLRYKDKEKQFDMEKIAKSLRIGVSGGASLPMEIINGVKEKFNISILEGYGLSETSPVATFNQTHKEIKPGSTGTPIWGMEIRIEDENGKEAEQGKEGEVLIRGHSVMKGYYNKPEETAKAIDSRGWFHSGDIGKLDEEGYLYIVDRLKDMIISSGFNIYPREIEEVMMTHPDISMVAVIGIPHDSHGERPKAYVVANEGSTIREKEIVTWCKEKFASYKCPRTVEIRESLPMNATGKILKKNLKAEAMQKKG